MNGIISRIEAVSGVEGDMVHDGRNGVRVKAKFEDAADQIKVNKAGSNLNELYTQAIARGIPAATALRVLSEAEGSNRLPELISNPDGSFSFALGDSKLIEGGLTNGTGAYAPPPPVTPPPQGQQNQQNQSTQQQSGAIPTRVLNLIDDHNKTTDVRTQRNIKAKIGRILGGSIPPNVANQLR